MSDLTTLRFAAAADADNVTALINAAFRIVEEFFLGADRITVEEVLEKLATGVFLLAESDNAISGCVYLEPRGERAYLGLLSVDPSRQQSGLGSQLMTAGENYCREQGARFVDILIVNLRTDLPEFYQRRGYVANGTTPFPADVPTKLPCHFINMSKPL